MPILDMKFERVQPWSTHRERPTSMKRLGLANFEKYQHRENNSDSRQCLITTHNGQQVGAEREVCTWS